MKIQKETETYNSRRYGKPWIAKVDFSEPRGKYFFGDWAGDQRTGGEGILLIDADPGDIIAIGQKDFRKVKNSAPTFYSAKATGELEYIGDKGAAYKYYMENKDKKQDIESLLKEKEALLKKLEKIDALIAEYKGV